jgi:mono/diheme cytochrome c family protein
MAAAALIGGQPAARAQAKQQAASPAETAPAGNADNGKKNYNKYGCYECHGYSGQGGAAGARLNGNPISFTAFVRYTRAPRNQMPPYTAKVVSDKELADMYAFLHSLPKPVDLKVIPAD